MSASSAVGGLVFCYLRTRDRKIAGMFGYYLGMSVYHFTLHAYRSWRPDHPRGYAKKGKGYLPPAPEEAKRYDGRAKQPPALFNDDVQRLILVFTLDICRTEGWNLEGTGSDPSHVHQMISWRAFDTWERVDQRMKNLLALKLNRHFSTPGKRWFVRRHSAPRRVKDREHYDHLLETYFPDHPGLFWKVGDPIPSV